MQRAVQLAQKGAGWVRSNPLVGAVLVNRAGSIVAESYHAKFGGPHAEQRLLRRPVPPGATLYVTLEPCCHQGKTPPCLDLILRSGIRRVVIGAVDPNPLVAGRSIRQLRRAGVQVTVGVAKAECDYLIRTFRKWITTKQPFVLAKAGMSLDGKITAGALQYITNSLALQRVHQLRQAFDVIMVGANTIIHDNPRLNTRLAELAPSKLHHPFKVILDSRLRVPPHSRAIDEQTLIVCLATASHQRKRALARTGAEIFEVPPNRHQGKLLFEQLNLAAVFTELGARGYTSVLVEGGSYVFTTCINLQAIDEFYIFLAPYLFGATKLPFTYALQYAVTLQQPSFEPLGNNILIRGYADYAKTR